VEDEIDHAVGYRPLTRIGDEIKAGDALGVIYARNDAEGQQAAASIQAAITIGEQRPDAPQLVKEVIQ
jgi:thymidine phosphorylase